MNTSSRLKQIPYGFCLKGTGAWATLFPNYCSSTTRQSPIALTYDAATYSSSLSSSTATLSAGTVTEGKLEVQNDGVKCICFRFYSHTNTYSTINNLSRK